MESLADMGLATMKRFKLLQEVELELVEDQAHEWPKHLFLAQFDRFELWAVNLGVFVMGHGSLDYRIRDSESMKEAIHKMMNNLNRSLDEVLAYLHGNIEQEDEDSDTDSSSEMESDMDLLLDSIKDPIDRLYKMAVWIRNPATRIPSTKARNLQQVDEETNVDLFKSFENFDYDYVSSLFLEYAKNKALQENPTAQPHDAVGNYEAFVEDQVWEPIRKTLELNRMKISNGDESYLIHRIARANGLRRQQFAYWRKHKNKLREHATVAVEVPAQNMPTTSHTIQLEDENENFKVPLSVTTATQLRLSRKAGKELEKENAMTLAVSEYAPSAWNPSKDIVSFPLPPKASATDEFFECPYCYTICPASILSEKAWRAHLIRDLRPYICTFEQCLNSGQLYDSRDDWIQHETSTHQNVFRCPKHEEEAFTTLATYEEHTQTYHKEDAISPSFATSTATNIHRSCPICSIVLGTVQELQNHIALHLERLAMFSLPRCTDDNNEGGSGGRSASAHFDSARSFNKDLDTESNATGKTQHDSILFPATQFKDQPKPQSQIKVEQSRARGPLHDAAAQGRLTIDTLDYYKSTLNFHIDETDRRGRTALAYAALKGHIDVVKLLLSENADVNYINDKGRTALWYACHSHSSVTQQRRREVIKYLLDRGADPDVSANDGTTALMKIIKHRDPPAVKLLIDKSASIAPKKGATSATKFTSYEMLKEIRSMGRSVAYLRTQMHEQSEKKTQFFAEEMTKTRLQLKRLAKIVRAWPPSNSVNISLFELGEICIAVGLVDEAIETLEHLKLLQIGLLEHDDPALLKTERNLATAYQVHEALQEVDKHLGHDADLYTEPSKSKALGIFARTEVGRKYAEKIWGPSIWKTRQSQEELEREDDPDYLSQRPTFSRQESSFDTSDRYPLSMAFNKQEEFPPLTQNKDIHREEVYAQAQAQAQAQDQAQDQAQVPQQAHGNSDYELDMQTLAGFKYNRLMAMEAAKLGGLENVPQDVMEKFWQQSYKEAKESLKDSAQQKPQHQQQQQTASEEDNYDTPHVGQDHKISQILPEFGKRFHELMDQLFEESDTDENHILSEDDQVQHDVTENSRSELTGAEGELKSDSLKKVQGWISEAKKSQYKQPQSTPSIARDEFGNRDERSDVHEDVDLAGHSSQEPSPADHDRRVPMDPPHLAEFASERYFEKLRQLQADGQQADHAEADVTTTATASRSIQPLRDSSKPADEKPNPSVGEKERLLSMRQTDAADAGYDLNAVTAIAEQEMIDDPLLPTEETYEMREQRRQMESEFMVIREFYRYLEEESLAEIEKAGGDTQLKFEAQTLAQTLAQRIALHKSSVEELKGQFARASRVWERNEKGGELLNEIRTFRFGEMKDMIKEIQNKREARERNETQAQPEERLTVQIEEDDKALSAHQEKKKGIVEMHEKILETMHAGHGQEEEDPSAAPAELEARDPSTEVPVRIEMSEPEPSSKNEDSSGKKTGFFSGIFKSRGKNGTVNEKGDSFFEQGGILGASSGLVSIATAAATALFSQGSISAAEEKIRDPPKKIEALEEDLRLARAQREVQVSSGSENQGTKSRGVGLKTWKCCNCGMSGLMLDTTYQCPEYLCKHERCNYCTYYHDRVRPV